MKVKKELGTGMSKIVSLWTEHFVDRFLERFSEGELALLERTIECAFKKAIKVSPFENKKIRFAHPQFGFTVVVEKIGLNGVELITCWKNGIEIGSDDE
jgi:hypothetical protein